MLREIVIPQVQDYTLRIPVEYLNTKVEILILPFTDEANDTLSDYPYQQGQSSRIIKELEGLTNFEDILVLSSKYIFSEKQVLVNRLRELFELYDDDDTDISIESLKTLLVFFSSIATDFNIPIMTLNENGIFQVSWRKSNSNLITLRFKNENLVDYVIFRPSHHIKKAIILNGSMNLFDCLEYIKDLNFMELIKGKIND